MRLLAIDLRAQLLARTGNGKALIVQEVLDAKHAFHVNSTVHSLAGTALGRLKLGEFRFPEAQDVAGEATQAAHLADPKIELIGNDNFAGHGFPHSTLGKLMHRGSTDEAARADIKSDNTRPSIEIRSEPPLTSTAAEEGWVAAWARSCLRPYLRPCG